MALTAEKIVVGMKFISRLDTFPMLCGYLLMVLLAPLWKKFTSPLSLRPVSLTSAFIVSVIDILVVYNLSASVISLYTMVGFFHGAFQSKSTFEAQPMESLVPVFKIYAAVKIFELLDTVFMILRHRQRQISFLHVYHHSSMLILSDIAYKYYPYPALTSYLGLNSAVHVLLYLYYGLCALYPENPPQWKKFLTQFQIVQFLVDLIHATIGYIFYTYCLYGIFYGITMLSLFSNFYYKAYIRKSATNRKPLSNGSQNGTVKKTQ